MRRILVDRARAKATQKRGGDRQRLALDDIAKVEPNTDLLALDEALGELESHDELAARLVNCAICRHVAPGGCRRHGYVPQFGRSALGIGARLVTCPTRQQIIE